MSARPPRPPAGRTPASHWTAGPSPAAVVGLAAVAACGVVVSLLAGLAAGMTAGQLGSLAALLVPTAVATGLIGLAAEPLLRRAPIAVQLVALAVLAATVSVATLSVLGAVMVVRLDDLADAAALAAASTAGGVVAALLLARRTAATVDRLSGTVTELGEGNLDARAGPIDSGPELARLADAIDRSGERMAEALEAERAAESARRDLFTAVSHDLRTPLAAVRAIVESIDDGVVTDPDTIERYFGQLKHNVEVLAGLVDDLFELATIERADFMSDLSSARVGDVVAAAVRSTSAQAASKDVTLSVELDGAGELRCSPRLVRVLHNLLQNAITHSPEGSVVTVGSGGEDGRMKISVCDEGEGMEPEDAARAFEPFYRADPARHGPGAGLGLALVERIVTGLGGAVELDTARGAGSRFTIDLPRAGASATNS